MMGFHPAEVAGWTFAQQAVVMGAAQARDKTMTFRNQAEYEKWKAKHG